MLLNYVVNISNALLFNEDYTVSEFQIDDFVRYAKENEKLVEIF